MAVYGMQVSVASGKAFIPTDEECSKAVGKLRKIVDDYGIPSIEETRQWTVYKAERPGHCVSHHSIVFQDVKTGKAFYVHITVVDEQVVFDIKHLLSQQELEFTRLGTVEETAKKLLVYALRRARDHGDFNELSNNCQTYCTDLAKDLGLEGYWTDAGKAGIGVGVAGGLVLTALAVGAAFSYLLGGSKKKDN